MNQSVNNNRVINFADLKKEKVNSYKNKIREYEDRYEFCYIPEYEDKFNNFEANSIQLGEVFPQLFDLGNRVILVSLDFYKERFDMERVVIWLENNRLFLGDNKLESQTICKAAQIVEGIRFKGYPLVQYLKGQKVIDFNPANFPEVTAEYIGNPVQVDTGRSKPVQDGLTIFLNGEPVDGVPRIDFEFGRDLIISNGQSIVADYIDDYDGTIGFYRNDNPSLPVVSLLDRNTNIYINIYQRSNGSKVCVVEHRYLLYPETM